MSGGPELPMGTRYLSVAGECLATHEPYQFIAFARTDDGSLAVILLLLGREVVETGEGEYTSAGEVTGTRLKAEAPNRGDWVLLLTKKE